ncbi:hypothetical protein [Gaopeijia maritima]|uniref:hypothetical protein n=1 Tax=Gaopeijia maritima TaxID=3119007 RepID=UPI0032708B68
MRVTIEIETADGEQLNPLIERALALLIVAARDADAEEAPPPDLTFGDEEADP